MGVKVTGQSTDYDITAMVWLVSHVFRIDERSKAEPLGPVMRKNPMDLTKTPFLKTEPKTIWKYTVS